MECAFDTTKLQGAEVAFAFASRLIYSEPQKQEVASYIEDRTFVASPFGMDNKLVQQGLAKLQSWCDAAGGKGPGAGATPNAGAAGAGALAEATAALQREWLALFVGAGTPKAPSWASYYTEPNSQLFGKETLEVRAWYRRWGLQIERLHSEPDDNLGLLLGFTSRLIALEAQATEKGHAEEAEELRQAQADFLAQHVLPWLPAWHYLAAKHAASDFYRGIADFVFGLCQAYAARFGITYSQEKEAFFFSQAGSGPGASGGPEAGSGTDGGIGPGGGSGDR